MRSALFLLSTLSVFLADHAKADKKGNTPYLFMEGEPVLVGRGAANGHFWKPAAFAFGQNRSLVRVNLNDDEDCGCPYNAKQDRGRANELTTDTPPCHKPCAENKYANFISTDSAATFEASEHFSNFCEGGGVEMGQTRFCPELDVSSGEVKRTVYNVGMKGAPTASGAFTFPETVDTRELAFGPSVFVTETTSDTYWVITEAGKPALFKSNDTKNYTKVGDIPIANVHDQDLYAASIIKKKDNVLVVGVKTVLGSYVTIQSRTGGKLWGKPEKIAASHNSPRLASTYYTTVTAGGGIEPYVSYVREAQKKISRRNFTLSDHVEELYSVDFLEGGDVVRKCNEPPYFSFCESTGTTTFMNMFHGNFGLLVNSSSFLMCYDKLANGWTGPALPSTEAELASPEVDAVYCATMRVSDEEPVEKYQDKTKKAEKKREKAKEQEDARKERLEEKRKAREEREKEKEVEWRAIDAAYLVEAQRYAEEDGEIVIVREWDEEFKDYLE